jgi:dUTP pyrophosphatase
MIKLLIKKVRDVQDVQYNKEGDAAIDLRSSGFYTVELDDEKREIEADEYALQPGERILVKTGLEIHIPSGFWGNIRDRSGLALKHGLHTLGGVIDENYRGEIGVILVNLGKVQYLITKNERIAQMIVTPYLAPEIDFVDDLETSERGKNGFGASGKH